MSRLTSKTEKALGTNPTKIVERRATLPAAPSFNIDWPRIGRRLRHDGWAKGGEGGFSDNATFARAARIGNFEWPNKF